MSKLNSLSSLSSSLIFASIVSRISGLKSFSESGLTGLGTSPSSGLHALSIVVSQQLERRRVGWYVGELESFNYRIVGHDEKQMEKNAFFAA